jgi:hypothetical protein
MSDRMRLIQARDLPALLEQIAASREVYGFLLPIPSKRGYPGPAFDESQFFGAAPNPNALGYDWNCQMYSGNEVVTLTGNPLRRLLIIENLTTTPVAVSFGIPANYGGTPAQTTGLVLTTTGSVLYVDRNCPTNTIYIDVNGSTVAVVQGTPGN